MTSKKDSDPIRILVLDDNAIDRERCRRILSRDESARYEVIEHGALAGALDLVQREEPDCIVLDYHLHDGNGLEFLKELDAIGGARRYPVVMLTGTGSEAIAVEVMKAGAQDYLVKNRLNAELLQRTVASALFKARTARLLQEQQEEMERLFREAQEANARKDQFLAALSHELRTPLTPVLAAVSALEMGHTDPEDLHTFVAIIRRNVELEARLIDDMLDLTRIARGKLEVNPRPVDLHSALHHAAQACEGERAAKNIAIDWRLEAHRFVAQADPARIQQVFWNVLKNALKFTPERGRVSVRTRNIDGVISIEITDTGIGLRPGTEDKIFDAFEQGGSEITRRYGGLGLGLAISKALVEAHGGSIRASANPDGAGARITIDLGVEVAGSNDGGDETRERSRPPKKAGSRGCTVLLVEDHEDSAFFIKRILDRDGYRTLVAGNVADALELFQSEAVDCVVSDLGLPDGLGTDLIQRITAIRPVPAVALSGYGMESDVQRSLAAGFARHLTKPVDINRLEATLAELVGE